MPKFLLNTNAGEAKKTACCSAEISNYISIGSVFERMCVCARIASCECVVMWALLFARDSKQSVRRRTTMMIKRRADFAKRTNKKIEEERNRQQTCAHIIHRKKCILINVRGFASRKVDVVVVVVDITSFYDTIIFIPLVGSLGRSFRSQPVRGNPFSELCYYYYYDWRAYINIYSYIVRRSRYYPQNTIHVR